MAIGGIGQFDLYTDYQRMSAGRNALSISKNYVDTDNIKDNPKNEVPEQKPAKVDLPEQPLENISLRKNASIEDISLDFSVDKDFAMKGQNSNLESLDMQKAISDMQKDQTLMQYQYFVGDSQNLGSSDDGIVLRKL